VHQESGYRSHSESVYDGLTYPEEQVIESHYTENPEKLGCVALAVLVFYNVSGGPFGIETTVRAGGFFYALLGFLVFPFIWSLQEALMTAELGTTFVEASGGVAWVEEAFGPGAGWMSGYLGWIAGATDNAIYPVLFLDYLFAVSGQDSEDVNPVLRFCLLSATSVLLAYINWRGLPMVGKMSVGICMLAMSPFLILVLVGSFKCDPSRWLKMPSRDVHKIIQGLDDDVAGGFFPNSSFGGVLWRPYLNNLFWNLNSFDAAGTLVAELDNTKLFLRAMMLGVVLVIGCYFFPLLIAIGASDSEQTDWTNGYLASINREVVGPWLGAWTVLAAGISNIAMFQAELSSDAFQLMGMADRGHLPKIFSKRSRHGTPTFGIILGTAVIVFMGASNLDELVEMLNFNYALSLLLEYAAFFKLRISKPDLERPYRIPLNTFGCVCFFLPAIIATLAVMSLATFKTFYFALGSWFTGYMVFYAKQRSAYRFG
jgi:amino acid transporter